jgi:hypothetical protein
MIDLIKKLICGHEWNPVDDHGYQSCKKCGKSRYIGFPDCIHNWDIHDTIEGKSIWSHLLTRNYIMRCNKCGEMKNFKSNS